jgi:hypothetical protein
MTKRLLLPLFLLLALAVGCRAADTGKRTMLVLGSVDWKLAQLLTQQGYEMAGGSVESLDPQTLHQYQAIIMLGAPYANNDFTIPDKTRQGLDALVQYVREGGGLWINQWHGQIMRDLPCLDYLSKPFGLRWPMCRLTDPSTTKPGGFRTVAYAFTDQIPASPVNEGVKQLWYPVANDYQAEISSLPLDLSSDWIPVVKSGPGAKAELVDMKKFGLDDLALHQELSGALPLFAVRSFEKGRVAACSFEPPFHLLAGNCLPLGRIFMANGLDGKPSDGERLVLNTLNWLTDAGRAAGFGGPVQTPPQWLRDPNYLPPAQPLAVDLKFGPYPRQYRGLIGARTTYSVGKATTREWVDAAKRAGLDFLVFTEDYEKLSDADFEKLRQECQELSSDKFGAVPGVIMRDIYGDYFIACGSHLMLPNDSERNPRMRRLGHYSNKAGEQMGMQLLNWSYTRLGFNLGLGSCFHRENAIPYYDYRDYWMMAVVSQINGQVEDEALQPYLHLINRGETLTPVGLTLMDSPEELSGLKTGQLFWTAVGDIVTVDRNDPSPPRAFFSQWQSWASEGLRYMSNGPRILSWSYQGSRDYTSTGEYFLTTWYPWPARLAVASDVGLAEVKVMDGQETLRRFLPQGAKTFEAIVPLVHNQQHNLVLVVKDTQGHWAVSGELWDHNESLESFMCGDRNNQLFFGQSRRADGTKFNDGRVMGIIPTKGVWSETGSLDPAANFQGDPVLGGAVPGFDAAVGGEPMFQISPGFRYQGGSVNVSRFHVKTDALTTSMDFASGQAVIDGVVPADCAPTNVWDLLTPIEPNPWMDGWLMRLDFNTRPADQTLSVWTSESSFTAKQDFQVGEGQKVEPLPFGYFQRGGATRVQVGVDGKVVLDRGLDEAGANWSGDLNPGDWIAVYGSPLGGMALYPRDRSLCGRVNGSSVELRYRWSAPIVKQGTTFKTSLLAVGAPFTVGKDNADFAGHFADVFGLDGPPAYSAQVLQGKLIDRWCFFHLDGQGRGAEVKVGKCDLPAYLPLKVDNLNPNWSAGLYEVGTRRYRPIGLLHTTGLAQMDPAQGDLEVFVGHPFFADNPDIHLSYMETGNREAQLEVHNPTDQTLQVTVQRAPAFTRAQGGPFVLRLAPGSSQTLKIVLKP